MADTTTPVVVLRSGRHGGLGVARSLGRLGVRVYAVDSDPAALSFYSKYCRGSFVWNFDDRPPAQSVENLIRIGRAIGARPVIIPTTDSAALMVADYAGELRHHYSFPNLPAELARNLCSKKSMHFLAGSKGVPTPRTFFPANRRQASEFADEAGVPLIMKTIDEAKAKTAAARRKIIARNKQEMLEHYDRMEDEECPNLMLQEYIAGGESNSWMFNGYFDKSSRCLFGLTGRKIRQHRPYSGITSLGICEQNITLWETTQRFMAAIGYQGILDIGYRFDARDGLYKVFDVNPRLGCTFRLFVSNSGMDVARATYLDLTGQAVAAGEAPVGRKWIVEDLDLVSSLQYWREGTLSPGRWLASFRGVREAAFFARDDLRPAAQVYVRDVWQLFRRATSGYSRPKHVRDQSRSRSLSGKGGVAEWR
jgi:D-aspartate ligase